MMTDNRTASSGAPALVACMCAVATVLALGSYVHLRGQLGETEDRLERTEQRLASLEADRTELAQALVALRGTVESAPRAEERGAAFPSTWPTASAAENGETGAISGGQASTPVDLTAAAPLREDPAADPGGSVLVVSPKRAQIMVDMGRRDGLGTNDLLLIYRNGRFIGEVEVAQAPFYRMAVCKLVSAADVRVGDRVRRD